MQVIIAGIHTAKNNEGDCAKKMRAGFVWDDDDLKTLGLDPHYLPLDVVPDDAIKQRTTCIFQAWLEVWAEVHSVAHGDHVLEQRILRIYGGPKFVDPDSANEFIVHQNWASFEKEKGNNFDELFFTLDGFDDLIVDNDQPDKYEP